MEAKVEIVSTETIKPSTPTPDHLRDFKLSFFDQLILDQLYIPILLCYPHHDIKNAFGETNDYFSVISQKLKTSLSQTLTIYYPYCGTTVKDNISIECNDTGVVFIESKVHANLSDILKNPLLGEMVRDFLPFDPYNFDEPEVNLAIQLNQFSCGGIALGVSFNHKIGDAITVGYFLKAWSLIARGQGSDVVVPQMETANLYFPQRNKESANLRDIITKKEELVTKRFTFSGTNLSRLRDKLSSSSKNLSRVEAVSALIWKAALEAAIATSKEQKIRASKVCHIVGIRPRMVPPLPDVTRGNTYVQSLSPSLELKGDVGLHDFSEMTRKAVRSIDADYVSRLKGDGILKALEELKEPTEEGVPIYTFSGVSRSKYYESDFGWGKPTWVGTVARRPLKNAILLLPTRDSEGAEAWVTLSKVDMVEFERNPELLHYVSLDS